MFTSLVFKVSTGEAVTSSAVGINEPVTTIRSTVAAEPVSEPAALVGGGAAAGAWPNRLLPTRKGSATMAAIAARRYPSAFNICDLISFSIGVWLGLAGRIKEEFPPDKRFFHFFHFFLNDFGVRRVRYSLQAGLH
jgi:hypothetical protein